MHQIELVTYFGLDTFHLVIHILVKKAYQVKIHQIELVAYLSQDTFHLVVHTLVKEPLLQVKQKVILKVYCFDTFLPIQNFKNC